MVLLPKFDNHVCVSACVCLCGLGCMLVEKQNAQGKFNTIKSRTIPPKYQKILSSPSSTFFTMATSLGIFRVGFWSASKSWDVLGCLWLSGRSNQIMDQNYGFVGCEEKTAPNDSPCSESCPNVFGYCPKGLEKTFYCDCQNPRLSHLERFFTY